MAAANRPSLTIRLLLASREAFGFAAGGAALHVDDLAVAEREDLEAFVAPAIGSKPLRRADDLVADLGELRLHGDPSLAPLVDLKVQDLTGLIGTVSNRCALPPQMAVRDAAPLIVFRD